MAWLKNTSIWHPNIKNSECTVYFSYRVKCFFSLTCKENECKKKNEVEKISIKKKKKEEEEEIKKVWAEELQNWDRSCDLKKKKIFQQANFQSQMASLLKSVECLGKS